MYSVVSDKQSSSQAVLSCLQNVLTMRSSIGIVFHPSIHTERNTRKIVLNHPLSALPFSIISLLKMGEIRFMRWLCCMCVCLSVCLPYKLLNHLGGFHEMGVRRFCHWRSPLSRACRFSIVSNKNMAEVRTCGTESLLAPYT